MPRRKHQCLSRRASPAFAHSRLRLGYRAERRNPRTYRYWRPCRQEPAIATELRRDSLSGVDRIGRHRNGQPPALGIGT